LAEDELELISLLERVHRRLLHVIKLEIEALSVHDINNVQTMMLFDVGDAEMTIGELALRGSHPVSNVSYNVKKMADMGYLTCKQSRHDRRTMLVRSTRKGRSLCQRLGRMHRRHMNMRQAAAITQVELRQFFATLRKLDRFWAHTELTARSEND
jgi:DNA-binding MarR family transcriptional regulator